MMLKRSFFSSNLKSSERIGPHDFLIIELFFGSLLGDCYAEKRNNSTRFVFHQSSRNVEYISFYGISFNYQGLITTNSSRYHQ